MLNITKRFSLNSSFTTLASPIIEKRQSQQENSIHETPIKDTESSTSNNINLNSFNLGCVNSSNYNLKNSVLNGNNNGNQTENLNNSLNTSNGDRSNFNGTGTPLKRTHPDSLINSNFAVVPAKIQKQEFWGQNFARDADAAPERAPELQKSSASEVAIRELNTMIENCSGEDLDERIKQLLAEYSVMKAQVAQLKATSRIVEDYALQLKSSQVKVREQCNWIWHNNEEWKPRFMGHLSEAKNAHQKRFEKLRMVSEAHIDAVARAINSRGRELEKQIELDKRTIQTVKDKEEKTKQSGGHSDEESVVLYDDHDIIGDNEEDKVEIIESDQFDKRSNNGEEIGSEDSGDIQLAQDPSRIKST